MADFVSSCPHCHTEKVAFSHYGQHGIYRGGVIRYWNTLYVCRKCEKGIVVEFSPSPIIRSPKECPSDPQDHGFMVRNTYPAPRKLEAPYAVPEGIAGNYIEAENNFARKNFESAGMMFRRVLDRATQRLAPEHKDKKLYARIEWLAEQHKITPELHSLAHFIRDDGNAANHEDEEFTEESAKQMKDFTHLFLMYTFTLPKYVAEARGKDEPAN